jgi:hypothetical protein
MPRKATRTAAGEIVTFEIERNTYQIDPELKKVYRRFVEIEKSKAAEIFSMWRSQQATA